MSRLSDKIRSIFKYSESSKVTDKKKCMSELSDLYHNRDVIHEITQNTKRKIPGIVNWSGIIHTTHRLVIDEAQRLNKGSTATTARNNERRAIITLLMDTIRIISDEAAIEFLTTDIISLILQILRSDLYIHYQDTYSRILLTYILRQHHARHSNVTVQQWTELLLIYPTFYEKTCIDKHIILDTLRMIVECSFPHADILTHIKRLLFFLEHIFEDVKLSDQQLIESFYKLTNCVCRQIAGESRITLCVFSENLIPDILHLSSSEAKYQLLLLFVHIHHPQVIITNSNTFKDDAYDWNKWKYLLRNIYLLILENCKLDIQWTSFLQLASEVIGQILLNDEENFLFSSDVASLSSTSHSSQPATKRRRFVSNVRRIVDFITIIDDNSERMWPFVRILAETFQRYPQCLQPHDFTPLLQRLTELARCRDESLMDHLYKFAVVLMENETFDDTTTTIYWTKIWDALLRSLEANQNEESCHILVSCFLRRRYSTLNLNALLKLYVTNTIRWSPNSVRTLLQLTAHISLPEDTTSLSLTINSSPSCSSTAVTTISPLLCDRTRLLEWLLSAPWQKFTMIRPPIREMCILFINILISPRCKQNIRMNFLRNDKCDNQPFFKLKNIHNLKRDIYSTDLPHLCYSFSTFNINFLPENPKETLNERDCEVTTTTVYCVQKPLDFLKKRLYDIIEEQDSNVNENTVHISLIKLAFVAKLLSELRQLKILTEDVTKCPLIDRMRKNLKNIFQTIANIDSTRCKYTYIADITLVLSMLYGMIYSTDIAKIIVLTSTSDMLKNVFDFLNIDDTRIICSQQHNSDYYQNMKSNSRDNASCSYSSFLCTNGLIRFQIIQALTFFCTLHIGPDKSQLQTKMMKNLLTIHQQENVIMSNIDFDICLTILESFAISRDQSEIQREYMDVPLQFLLRVCNKTYRINQDALGRLLKLLPVFFKYATSVCSSNFSKSIVETVLILYKCIYERNYGILIHNEYIKCVCAVIQIDPCFSWSDGVFTDITAMLDTLLDYIANPLFMLRSRAVQCLQDLISCKSVPCEWKQYMFHKTEELVLKLFEQMDHELDTTLPNPLWQYQRQDDEENKTATALIALASVVCANGVLQGPALHTMLRLTVEKEVKVNKVVNILSVVTRQTNYPTLIEDNLNYLLTSWIKAKFSIQTFPWMLTGCQSQSKFFQKHINHFVAVLFRAWNLDQTVSFCDDIHVRFADVFENIFPSCFIWLVSRICDPSCSNIDRATFDKLLANSDEFASIRSFNRLFKDHFQNILLELVQRLHDEEYFQCLFSIVPSFPEVDPPHFSKDMIDRCFSSLQCRFFKKTSLTRLLVEQPETLQRLLLELTSAVHFSRSNESKLKCLHQYVYFSFILMQDLDKPFFENMSSFLIRDVCCSLLYMAKSGDGTLSVTCCKFLQLFLKRVLPSESSTIRDLLRFIVANLIDLAQQIPSTIEIVSNLLRFLIVEQTDVLQEAIANLNSFPNLDIFKDIRQVRNIVRYKDDGAMCLRDELKRFLRVINDKNAEYILEDLMYLTKRLSTNKRELNELHRNVDNSNFQENNVGILHQLIFKLLELTESTTDPYVSIEATKCLGELGPIDSKAIVALRSIKTPILETEHAIQVLTYQSIVMLTNFLVEESINLRKVSANALYAILSTTWGRKLFFDAEYLKELSHILGILPLNLGYIRPFVTSLTTTTATTTTATTSTTTVINNDSFSVDVTKLRNIFNPENVLWTLKMDNDYLQWIVNVTCGITECFTNTYFKSFLPVCQLSVDFCELILPRVIHLIIVHNCANSINAMSRCINHFFRYRYTIKAETATTLEAENTLCDRKIVCRMLDVVNHLRMQLPDGGIILKLDYIYLAKAAQKCSAYYTALMFAQLACESILTEYPDFSNDTKIDYIYTHQPELGKLLQDIVQDTYLNISEPDAVYGGAGSSHLLDHNSLIQHYARTNKWDKVIFAQDVQLSYGDNLLAAKEMANALHHSELQFLQWQFLNGNKIFDEKFSYECAWRLGNWDLNVSDFTQCQELSKLSENTFYKYHYHALRCFHENDQKGAQRAIDDARKSVIYSLKLVSLESSLTINEKLSQLRLLREIEQFNSSSVNHEDYAKILRQWDEHEILTVNDQFKYVEPILRQRITMFQIKDSLRSNINVQQAFFQTCIDLATIAKDHGNFPTAATALGILAKHPNLSQDIKNQLRYQESVLAWIRNDKIIARRLLRSLIDDESVRSNLKAKVLRVYGDWMAETKSENPQTVIQRYYLKSIETSQSLINEQQTSNVVKNLHDTQIALARFADTQYEQINAYMKSPIYESLKESVEYAHKIMAINQTQLMSDQSVKRAVTINRKQSTNDAAELKNIEQERRSYLSQALKYYVKTLQQSEEYNLLIFRVVALWLDNAFDESINELLDQFVTVPSAKFIPLVPQLAAHITDKFDNNENSFSMRIFQLLERCALQHPHHTLPVILALKNLHSDDEYDSERIVNERKEERRVLGAKKLLKRLMKSSIQSIIHEMQNLSIALMSLAYWQPKTSSYVKKRQQIPRNQPISKIRNLNHILMPTISLPVSPSGNYDNVIGIREYRQSCEFVGGITAPKTVVCVGTDGIERRQLIKGKDDLRQDAVMQQVFTVMNTLLRTCKETNSRKLRIRTYKVVPLAQRSGVLEWCDNTLPLTPILTNNEGTVGLHYKYYPTDLTAKGAREQMRSVTQQSNEIKLNIFLDCCKRIRPAFHHFFEEKYPSPEIWVERTLTYTRSVAVTSIAGYILGIGDRHLNNILIDERTAEVVHIDFGIAFEQGKVLPLPETIPFRLTRDIEAAMGVSGIEGTMRRSCEETVSMLRDQKQIIITLLQVLLYDPLFTWTITPEKACQIQQNDVARSFSQISGKASGEANKIAKRALLRIEQKLQGTEDGLTSSISGQVERLLQEARDPANLCRVYYGWQPYL